jgi:uncharacterized membrane protein (UPF0127 family)
MNLARRMLGKLTEGRRQEPNPRWKISNLTRGTVLAERVETANRGATRRKGLLGRDGLPSGEGLWIVPCESVHTFFMRFPIDLVYVDRKLRVRKVRSGVPPWRLSACLSAHSVVELTAGTVHATQTQAGDALEFSPTGPVTEKTAKQSRLCKPSSFSNLQQHFCCWRLSLLARLSLISLYLRFRGCDAPLTYCAVYTDVSARLTP